MNLRTFSCPPGRVNTKTPPPNPSAAPTLNMYTGRDYNYKPKKSVVRMDPDCAICHAPATLACDCEAKGLEVAVRQAEARMMQSIYNDIRYVVPRPDLDTILLTSSKIMGAGSRSGLHPRVLSAAY